MVLGPAGGPESFGAGVDNDSVLLLRQMVIAHLAYLGRRRRHLPQAWSFLEQLVDPKKTSAAPSARKCSSICAALGVWHRLLGHALITFDQCRLGQVVKKSTTLSTNLELHHWHGLCCDHDPGAYQQRELSRPQI